MGRRARPGVVRGWGSALEQGLMWVRATGGVPAWATPWWDCGRTGQQAVGRAGREDESLVAVTLIGRTVTIQKQAHIGETSPSPPHLEYCCWQRCMYDVHHNYRYVLQNLSPAVFGSTGPVAGPSR